MAARNYFQQLINQPVAKPGGTLTEPWAMAFMRQIFGDVEGPLSAVDGDIALFDGTTGKLLKDGGTLSHLLDLLTE